MNEDMVYIGTRKYQSHGVCSDKLIQRTDLTLKSILENKINDMFFNKNTIANIAEQDVPNFKNMTKKMQNAFFNKTLYKHLKRTFHKETLTEKLERFFSPKPKVAEKEFHQEFKSSNKITNDHLNYECEKSDTFNFMDMLGADSVLDYLNKYPKWL